MHLGGVGWIHLAQCKDQWGGGSCEHDNEPSTSINFREIPEWLGDWRRLSKDPAPRT
jgi:hypothetical protein